MSKISGDAWRPQWGKIPAVGGGTAVLGGIVYAVTQSPVTLICFAAVLMLIIGYFILLATQRAYPRVKSSNWTLSFERPREEGDKDDKKDRDDSKRRE